MQKSQIDVQAESKSITLTFFCLNETEPQLISFEIPRFTGTSCQNGCCEKSLLPAGGIKKQIFRRLSVMQQTLYVAFFYVVFYVMLNKIIG